MKITLFRSESSLEIDVAVLNQQFLPLKQQKLTLDILRAKRMSVVTSPRDGEKVTNERCTDHLIGTYAHAPQRPMVMYTGMGTVDPSPNGLLRH
ncbi:hypothetical protein TNCV_4506791 [Trichonephila clavipes]|nr:hypothetical protein TNCV_4506791 [Trichonephila clavipes]